MILAIWPSMFMPKSDNVSELVNNDSELIAILTDGNRLRTLAAFSDEGAATLKRNIKGLKERDRLGFN